MTGAPTLAPGGFVWLLRHELRVSIRALRRGNSRFARIIPVLLLAIVPIIGGIALAFLIATATHHATPRAAAKALHALRGPAGAGVIAILVLMISTASMSVLRAFYERGDLDLLLAAPLRPSRILAAKSVGVAVITAAPFLVILGPFVLTSVVLGGARWLGALAMIAVDATMATAIAIVVTSVLFRVIGVRRARVAVQLASATLGGLVFLLSQAPNFAPEMSKRLIGTITRPWPAPLDWPTRAALGEPFPILALAAVAGVSFAGAVRLGAARLAAAGTTPGERSKVTAKTHVVRFRAGVARNIIVKELRLIVRDPELIAQVSLRMIYLIPITALVLRGSAAIDPGPAVAAAVTGFSGLLSSSLAWIIVCAEDAPDLIASAPQEERATARAKTLAACTLPLGFAATVAAVMAPSRPAAAAVTLGMAAVATTTAALVQLWFGRPAKRSAFRRRQAGSIVIGIGEVAMAGAWAATASQIARGSVWAIAPALVAGMILAGAVEARPTARDNR
jgi:ABC-2 type transport system permease protein